MPSDTESVERVIDAPAEELFAIVANPTRHPEIDGSGTVRGTGDPDAMLGLGDSFTMQMRAGFPYTMVSTVVEFEPNRRIAWQTRPANQVMGRLAGGRIWRYELEEVDGGTLVRETWDISEERFKRLVEPLRSRTAASMAKTLERLERAVARD